MAVAIFFPDGSTRDVPGYLVPLVGNKATTTAFKQVPVNCDPLWRYCQIDGHWHAVPRHGNNIAVLTSHAREWWRSIVQMQDQSPEPTSHVA